VIERLLGEPLTCEYHTDQRDTTPAFVQLVTQLRARSRVSTMAAMERVGACELLGHTITHGTTKPPLC
jgi:hypothetical protein